MDESAQWDLIWEVRIDGSYSDIVTKHSYSRYRAFSCFVGMYIGTGGVVDHGFYAFLFRWLHVISGVMWIGILWYFNFVQIPNMPNIPDDQKPAISKVIAPAALWWFRWGAMATLVTGIILAALNGYLIEAIALGGIDGCNETHDDWNRHVAWDHYVLQCVVRNLAGAENCAWYSRADADAKAAAARRAMLFSRTNTLLSIPMLFAMVSAQNNSTDQSKINIKGGD